MFYQRFTTTAILSLRARKKRLQSMGIALVVALFTLMTFIVTLAIVGWPKAANISPSPRASTATIPPSQNGLFLTFVATNPKSVAIQTQPGAIGTVIIHYMCSNHDATSESLKGERTANAQGIIVWQWNNESTCIGPTMAIVTVRWQDKQRTQTTTF
jgi:hypothetical protein